NVERIVGLAGIERQDRDTRRPVRRELLVRRHQAPIPMRLGARLAGAELALLAGLGTAGRTPNRQGLLLRRFHDPILLRRPRARWSILTTTFTEDSIFGNLT